MITLLNRLKKQKIMKYKINRIQALAESRVKGKVKVKIQCLKDKVFLKVAFRKDKQKIFPEMKSS